MARRDRKHTGAAGHTVETITIPADVQAAIDALPGKKPHWEPWKDEVVRKYYKTKGLVALCEILHTTHQTLKRRARELGL